MKCTITFSDGDELGTVNMETDFGDAETETGGIKLTPATMATIGAAALFRTDVYHAAGAIVTAFGGAGSAEKFDAGSYLENLLRNGDILDFAYQLMDRMNAEAADAEAMAADTTQG